MNKRSNRMWGGFTLVLGMVLAAFSAGASAQEAVCAVVKIEIQQELTLERQAFDAHMRINNGLDTMPLENVEINVTFEDENGKAVLASSDPNNTEALFYIRMDRMEGIADIDGAGVVQPASSADVHWLIIPTTGAGGSKPSGTLYFVGASLSYTMGGETESMTVTPDSIYVKPLPRLTLDYFLTQDVYADDAFTPEIEPSEPFTLGVRVRNNGAAAAQDVSIDSAQPKIVENEQGLLIDFKILGSSVNDQPASNSLLIDFGDIPANAASVGRWDMITTLSGKFTEFTATVSHADELGGQLTSLIEAANTHFLVHDVRVDLPGRDAVRDFLARDGDVLRVHESDSVDTEVTDQSSGSTLAENGTDGTYTYLRLTAPVTAGFMYVQLPDAYQGRRKIAFVTRNDGKQLPPSNAWFSRQRKADNSWAHFINLFDVNTTGAYTIAFDYEPLPPEFQLLPVVTTWETNPTSFAVSATDPNGTVPSLGAESLPAGASFTDQGNGTGVITWTPEVGQGGVHSIVFTASDGELENTLTIDVRVNPVWDTDGDGMDDAWEREHFGDLSRDGAGDFDGDGILDADEFANRTDPTAATPQAPVNVVAKRSEGKIALTWDPVPGSVGYNVYWSLEPGVDRETGTKVSNVVSPFVHVNLPIGIPHYYVVTAVGEQDESSESQEVSAVPGQRAWGPAEEVRRLPVESNPIGPQLVIGEDGSGAAFWSEYNMTFGTLRLLGRPYTPGSGWGDATALDGAYADVAAMGIDGKSIVIDFGDGASGIYARWYSHTDGWLGADLIAIDWPAWDGYVSEYRFEMAVDQSGNYLVAWESEGGGIFARNYVEGAGWGEVVDVSSYGTAPRLATDGNGEYVIAWEEMGGIYTKHYSVANGWSASSLVAEDVSDLPLALAMNVSGDILLAWFNTSAEVAVRMFTPALGWEPPAALSAGCIGGGLSVGIDNNSAAMVICESRIGDGTHSRSLSSAHRQPHQEWSYDLLPRVDGITSAYQYDVFFRREGEVVLAFDTGAHDGNYETEVMVYRSESGWSPPVSLGTGAMPVVTMNSAGHAIVMWLDYEGSTIRSSRYSLHDSPPTANAGSDLEVVEGSTVSLSGSATSDRGIVRFGWTQVFGPRVQLFDAETSTVSFSAPLVNERTELTFVLTVSDADGVLASDAITLSVVEADMDTDGMADEWEFAYFGGLAQDGEDDYDGDGVRNRDEFEQGTDPTLAEPPLPPGSVTAAGGNGHNVLNWHQAPGALSYNVYWSTDPGVNRQTANKVEGASLPFVHAGLVNGTPYYYVVTAVGVMGESNDSTEAVGTPSPKLWQPDFVLFSDINGGSAEHLSLAVNETGAAVAVWHQRYGDTDGYIMSRRYLPGAGWDEPMVIAVEAFAKDVQVVIDAAGNALAAWNRLSNVSSTAGSLMASNTEPDGGWRMAKRIAYGAAEHHLAMNQDGEAALIWRSGGIYIDRYTPGHDWTGATQLSETGADADFRPRVGVDPRGNILAVWEEWGVFSTRQILSRRYSSLSHAWGPVTAALVAERYFDSGNLVLAMSPKGEATVAWTRTTYQPTFAVDVLANRFDPESGWSQAQLIETNKKSARMPELAMDSRGNVAAIWSHEAKGGFAVWGNHFRKDVGWGPEVGIQATTAGDSELEQRIAGDPAGHAVAVWKAGAAGAIYGARYSPASGSWSTEQELSDTAYSVFSPQVGLDSMGNALLVWRQWNGSVYELRAREYR